MNPAEVILLASWPVLIVVCYQACKYGIKKFDNDSQ